VVRHIGSDSGFEIDDESLIGWNCARRRIVGRKQLVVGVVKAFARIRSWHQVGMLGVFIDSVDSYLSADVVRIGFVARQSFEGLARRRKIAGVLIQKTQHLIERSIFQHQLDDVLYRGELIGQGRHLSTRAAVTLRAEEKTKLSLQLSASRGPGNSLGAVDKESTRAQTHNWTIGEVGE
jgi:hypothetical protein